MKLERAQDASLSVGEPTPEWISHYLIEKVIGEGASGWVYLALDARLDRKVAVKLLKTPKSGSDWIPGFGSDEARLMASLDHPNLVPIYDSGQTEEGLQYIVSKYTDGETLAAKLSGDDAFELSTGLRWLASVARAVHHAHNMGIVHRDIKPENILIDQYERPYLIDFGLGQAQTYSDGGKSLRVGTPPYFSPEQASGTAHRISDRSDIFALGVILYEMLTGRVPFSRDKDAMLREIIAGEITPPGIIAPHIPKPLEDLCLAALSRIPIDRPEAAGSTQAFAEILEEYASEIGSETPQANRYQSAFPKGLHSFDESDSEFFLDLLPGPKDDNGLPSSISLWKSRIESTALENSFRVALLYGPSGCGKSSFLRSGLLPQLSSSIVPIFVEADADTESRILKVLHHRFPRLEGESDLAQLLDRIKAGEGMPCGCQLLIVVDQFEQHLHHADQQNDSLCAAFELCDGDRIKVLLSIRDDFWLSVSQFFSSLSIDIDTGRNAGAIDLFDLKHARDVVIRFGRGVRSLPEFPEELTRSQRKFVETVVGEIALDGRVSPIQIALLVEKFRDRPWNVSEWDKAGGISGIGISYVQGCFEKRISEQQRPAMIEAAQAIFNSLIPEDASSIKGSSRTRSELRDLVSSLKGDVEFDQLIYLLVREFRLLSPSQTVGELEGMSYCLAHDYLVPILQNWIDEENQRTREGRAQMLLRDRSKIWELDEAKRPLPSFAEWVRIVLFARSREWKDRERAMMKQASTREAIRLSICVLCVGFLTVWGINASQTQLAKGLHAELQAKGIESFESLQPTLQKLRGKIVPLLIENIEQSEGVDANVVKSQRILYRLGRMDATSHIESVLTLEPTELRAGMKAMGAFDQECIEILKTIANETVDSERAFRAHVLLAHTSEGLVDVDDLVEDWLLRDMEEVADWADAILSIGPSAHHAADKRYRLPVGYRPDKPYDFVVSARESAKVAVAYASIGRTERVRESLASKNRYEQRTQVISFLKPEFVKSYDLWTTPMENRNNSSVVAGLLQAIGEVDWEEIPDQKKPVLQENVRDAYFSRDAAVHCSASYALRRWKLYLPEVSSQLRGEVGSWFNSPSGISFVVLPDVEGRRIAIANTEIAVDHYSRVFSRPPVESEESEGRQFGDSPNAVTRRIEIMQFCNALSEREGLETCYGLVDGEWRPLTNFRDRTGYRIPTFSEWSFACKGASPVKFYFGNRIESLQWHAWIKENTDGRPRRVGLSRPNGYGLFDMLGNLSEWVHVESLDGESSAHSSLLQAGGNYSTPEDAFAQSIPVGNIEESEAKPFGGIRVVRTLMLDGN